MCEKVVRQTYAVDATAQHLRCETGTATVVAEDRVVVVVVATMGLVVEIDVVNTVVGYSRRLRLRRVVVIDTVVIVDPYTVAAAAAAAAAGWKMHSLLGVVAMADAGRMFETSA